MEMRIYSDGADFAAVMPILQRRRDTPTIIAVHGYASDRYSDDNTDPAPPMCH